jgi:hypothetical protein
VRWGFLRLDSKTGRFLIDQKQVDVHIEELRLQLAACKSIFDWIYAWNVYGARFFSTNFGKPSNSFGLAHVDMLLETFARIQSKLFASTGGSVTSTLKHMLQERFNVSDIPEGCLYFPMSLGGLDLKSPFIDLYLIRSEITKKPDAYMDGFFEKEERSYRSAKKAFHENRVPGRTSMNYNIQTGAKTETFMSVEEFTRYREQTSQELFTAYENLKGEPAVKSVLATRDVTGFGDSVGWYDLTPYQQWVIQLYSADMIGRFGGLNVVEKGLLPTGMVSMFRESRFKWQG